MVLCSQCPEPAGFRQSLRSLALGIVAHLQGTATAEELASVRRELELLERELAEGPGLLVAGGQDTCEDCVAAAFAQLCLAVPASPTGAPLETDKLFARGTSWSEQAGQDLECTPELLRELGQSYDWLCWAVLAWREGAAEEEPTRGNFVSAWDVAGRRLVACLLVVCLHEGPLALDPARTRQLIGALEWKLPNPPPEVYASLEAEPGVDLLKKLAEGLGPAVTLLVVPGKLEMKSGFLPAASLLHEYRHRLASGTVCAFG